MIIGLVVWVRVVRFKLDAVITNKAKYAVLLLKKSGQTSYIRLNNNDVWLGSWKQCVYLSSPISFLILFLFSVCMLLRCHPWRTVDFGFCGVFISSFFFPLCYQLIWPDRLVRKCTEVGQSVPKSDGNRNGEMTMLISLFLGKSGLVCLELHINDRLIWQFLWDCHRQSLNSRWKMDSWV